jgi:hypothetical protein
VLETTADGPGDARELADHVLARMLDDNPTEDDVALLTVSLD